MEAVICHNFGDATVKEVPRPSPGRNEVLVAVDRVQLSLTECDLYHGVEKGTYSVVRERLQTGETKLFGHEFCGTVVEKGAEVETFAEGDRVYSPGKIACKACVYCESGYEHLCDSREIIGRHRPGALAEYVSLPVQPLCRLPDEVSDAEGAAMQPMASSLHCAREANLAVGDVVTVFGTGVMGYQAGQFALHQGAGTVLAVDIDDDKLDIAKQKGMIPVNATEQDPVQVVDDITDGVGSDVVFEAIGGEQEHMTSGSDPLAQALDTVRRGGTIVQVGHVVGEVSVEPKRLRSEKVTWTAPISGIVSTGPNADTGTLTAKMCAAGRISIEEYITHELEGLDSFEKAIDITRNKQEYGAFGPAQIIV